MIAPSSYGALSATSANTIQGHKPGFTGQSGAKKLGFKVGNISYSEANLVLGGSNTDKDKIVPGTPREFERTLKLNEFSVQGLTVSDFTVATDYFDADGDGAANPAFTVVGGVSHKWFDGNGDEITDENKMVGCSGLSQPLTLKINLAAQSHSKYGDPRDSDPAGLVQSYQIKSPSGICFAQPNAMKVSPSTNWMGYTNSAGTSFSWNGGSITPHQDNGGGYDPAHFDPTWGFKASLGTKFPTTGFPGASFNLIMTSNANDYTFTHDGGSAVTIGTDGKVTLNSKPSGPVTIKAKFNATSQIHEYTFDPRTVWVVPKPNSMNYASAVSTCGLANMPTRAQLTNSPRKTAPQNWSYIANVYTRKVDGSLFSEWGNTNSSTYPGSQWNYSYYWTRAPWSTSTQFSVGSNIGHVYYLSTTSTSYHVACLE
ncbi:hypothetical protein RCS94_07495 [Orbaceae bacterium ac157xtp]